jgi:hypothetical protein
MKKLVSCYLVLAMVVIGVVPRVEASFLSSETIATVEGSDRAADLKMVRTALETKLVSQRLVDLGFTPEEVGAKISQLNDQQIHQVAQKLDEVRVGQDFGIVIGILVIAGLVVLIYYLLHHQVVVK